MRKAVERLRGECGMETDQEKMARLERENSLLKDILNHIHEGVMVTNKEGHVEFYNKVIGAIEETSPEEMVGRPLLSLYPFSQKYSSTLTVMKTGKPIFEMEHCYLSTNGKLINIIYSTLPFIYRNQMEGAYCIIRDVTKMGNFLTRSMRMYHKLNNTLNADFHKNGTSFTLDDIITQNAKMRELIAMARNASIYHSNVLVCGETGTGKELFAQGIHNAGLQSGGKFVAVNCAALPANLIESLLFGTVKGAFTGGQNTPGLFEQAEGGTIFLDEINSMSFGLQGKLLRVLQDKTVRRIGGKENIRINCRIISATNQNPLEEIKAERLRQDLFYRLSAIYIGIPPLRERIDDLSLLAKHFINQYNSIYGKSIEDIDNNLLGFLTSYPWPGNVRELEHFIESSCINVDPDTKHLDLNNIPESFEKKLGTKNTLPPVIPQGKSLNSALQSVEKQILKAALEQNDYNISKTAKELGIHRQALHYRINKFGLRHEQKDDEA